MEAEGLQQAAQRILATTHHSNDFGPAVHAPYQLAPPAAKLLNVCARKDCRYCHGSGVGQWRRGGRRAIVCKCAREKWHGFLTQPPKLDTGAEGHPPTQEQLAAMPVQQAEAPSGDLAQG